MVETYTPEAGDVFVCIIEIHLPMNPGYGTYKVPPGMLIKCVHGADFGGQGYTAHCFRAPDGQLLDWYGPISRNKYVRKLSPLELLAMAAD